MRLLGQRIIVQVDQSNCSSPLSILTECWMQYFWIINAFSSTDLLHTRYPNRAWKQYNLIKSLRILLHFLSSAFILVFLINLWSTVFVLCITLLPFLVCLFIHQLSFLTFETAAGKVFDLILLSLWEMSVYVFSYT